MRRLVRPQDRRVVAGVAQGMADYFDVSVLWVRIVWALLFLPGGLPGLVPYLICWVIMPEGRDEPARA